MRKLSLLLVMLIFASAQLLAQRTITGKVTDANDGNSIPGVQVVVKGTTTGTVTDLDGKYSVRTPKNDGVLVFSYMGKKTIEIVLTTSNVVDVAMESSNKETEGVVVTALGISREKKSLGYATQEVNGEDLSKVRGSNVINSLSGRVAGVQITGASGQMGGGAKINIRGNTSLTKNNQPLFVVDGIPLDNSDYSYGATGAGGYDYGNLAQDINPDDVESVSILKGASASALYGSRAANGVVMITTKKGKLGKDKTLGVSVNSSVTFDKAKYFPKYQKLYGGGYGDFLSFEEGDKTYLYPDFATDESWGPKYDPSVMVLHWNSFDPWDTEHYMVERPWVYPTNDYTYYFKTGVNFTNNFAITTGNEKNAFRLSYTNMDITGIYPNSKLTRNTFNVNATSKISNLIDAFANVNYVQNNATGRPETGYGDRNPVQKMWQWIHTSVDYKELEDYMNPDGTQRTWNRSDYNDATPAYTDNPYWSAYQNYQNDRRDRVYGNLGMNLTFAPWLKLTARTGADFYKFVAEERVAVGSQAQSEYYKDSRGFLELNSEAFFTVNKRFAEDKFGLVALLGTSTMDRKLWRDGGRTVGGLITPGLYNISNSLIAIRPADNFAWKRINSIYTNISLDFNRILYLELTERNDWSSTLPASHRSYPYGSATLSFVATELEALRENSVLSFAKVRGGVAQVGNDTDPYMLLDYLTMTGTFMDAELEQNPRMSYPATLANPDLKPERTNSWEIGTELKFFKNRVGLDLSYFYKNTFDQIVSVRVSGATGYGFKNINAGSMSNKGVELILAATPVESKDFKWDLMFNMATLTNKVDELAEGLDYLSLGNGPFKVQSGAFVGMTYPIIYGTDYVKDDAGNIIVGPSGNYLPSEIKPLANVTPTFTAGLSNTFTYKSVDLSVLFDMQRGGNMYYLSYMWGMYSGILDESAKLNENGVNIREAVEDGGGVLLEGVYGKYNAVTHEITYLDADGNVSETPVPNTTRLDGQAWAEHHYDGPDMQSVFSTDFIKLREVRIGYELPGKYTGPIKAVKISAFGRNLAIFGAATQHFDPEYLQMAGSNAQGLEGGYLPSTLTYGFGLNFNF